MSDYRIEAATKEEWALRAIRAEDRIEELECDLADYKRQVCKLEDDANEEEARANRLAALLKEAVEAMKRIERAMTYPVATEINPRGWELRPRGDIEFAATELRAFLARIAAEKGETP